MTQSTTSGIRSGQHTLQDECNVSDLMAGAISPESATKAQAASGSGERSDRVDSNSSHTFFKVAERPLTSSTFLGQTNMIGVDFFAQTFAVLDKCGCGESETVMVASNDRIVVVSFLCLACNCCLFILNDLYVVMLEWLLGCSGSQEFCCS